VGSPSARVKPRQALSDPAISPDGTEIAFVAGGDIWTVPAIGGEARILIAHPATESRPLYSPDGKYLAFTSTRTGNGDVYVLTLATGDLKRLTFDDGFEQVDGWSPDSRYVYFSSTSHDISGMSDIFRVSREGGTSMEVTADRYTTEFQAAPAPDGKGLAFVGRGVASGQWWRHGHSHLDESELWLLRDISGRDYQRLMPEGSKQLWPMWSADGRTLYFMSDRGGNENIWSLNTGVAIKPASSSSAGGSHQITQFTSGRVLWPSISANGKTIVFERGFAIWKLDVVSGTASEVAIRLRGVPAGPSIEHLKITSGLRDLALSPDGKKIVFAAHGELFAASSKDGGEAVRITHTAAREFSPAWAPDNHRITYVSSRSGRDHIYIYDFNNDAESPITAGEAEESAPHFSPDGKMVGFIRGNADLVIHDFATKQEKTLAHGYFERPPLSGGKPFDWSPDSKYLAYANYGQRMFRNVSVVSAATTDHEPVESRPISYIPNTNSDGITWSPDGKYILLITGQRTEGAHVARIDLVPHTPKFREDQFRDLFKEETPSDKTQPSAPERSDAKPPDDSTKNTGDKKSDDADTKPGKKVPPKTEIIYEGIRDRVTLLPTGLDVDSEMISPDGKWLAMLAGRGQDENVYVYSLDELAKEPPVAKQLTATATPKSDLHFAPDSKELLFLDGGHIFRVPVDKAEPKLLAVSAEMDVDFNTEKYEVFEEGWRDLRDNFFDEQMNGTDWQAVHDEFSPYVAGARTGDDLRRVMSLMIGELNASHSGISAPAQSRVTSTGRLGLRFDRAEYENKGKLVVTEVIGLSPAAVAGIKVGETLEAVEGMKVTGQTNLDELLDYAIDRKINLSISDSGGKTRTVSLKPVRNTTEKNLLYRDWVNRNRAYVDRISGGKLGYVHMYDMSSESLERLFFDLDSENAGKKGIVIDVRNNNGGFVNAYALDVLARRGYMSMQFRGAPHAAPARTVLGQRSLELPTILVANQHSLSDAEDFTEGYRALGLGKVVGEPTGGWIIYTSNTTLIDGSSLRLPHIRITDHENKPMEMHPRPVDVRVQWSMGESYRGIDTQLGTAVDELLKQIGEPGVAVKRAAEASN